ncbi:MAG: PepSY-associated TM helix domain-containing protein [Burkholderiaceae bacterium]
MSPGKLRAWSWLHKWSSLVSTLFLLVLCLTGLPLIFHHQIGQWLGTEVVSPRMVADAPRITLDQVMTVARARFPTQVGMYVSQEPDDDTVWFVTMGDTPTSTTDLKQVAIDARTGAALAEPKLDRGLMVVIRRFHVDLFAGEYGKLFLGFMGLVMLLAIASGVVLYAPFMRKLRFGEVRRERSSRVKWLDLHNLLGIVTLTWALVVGATGVVNTWADLVIAHWRNEQMAEMQAHYRGQPPVARLGSLEKAFANARSREPATKIAFIAFPGTAFSSERHYGVFLRGRMALTARLVKPVLVDAITGEVSASRAPPWYLDALLLSQPLHFGDYGGVPLLWLWAALDVLTIFVLGSGLALWLGKRGAVRKVLASDLRSAPR